MKKRQIKKLARRGVDEMKRMKFPVPISTRKIQNALFLYLNRTQAQPTFMEPKLYQEFWDVFNNIGK